MKFLFAAVLLVCGVVSSVLAAQQTDLSKSEITNTKINDHLYMLEGGGTTVAVFIGSDAVLVVDGDPAPLAERVMAAIRKLSNAPIRFVINLNSDQDNTGTNAHFAAQGAAILAKQRSHASNERAVPEAPAVMTFDGPITLRMADEEIVVRPLRPAHSAGDMLVWFTKADVVMVGDIYRPAGYPDIGLANGGSLDGLVDALGVVGGMAGGQTKIIPSHGPAVTRPIIIAYRDIVMAVRDRVAEFIKQGKTVDEVLAAKVTHVYDGVFPQASATADPFVREVYTELQHAR